MKHKSILTLFVMCAMALAPVSALADTPTPYERLKSEVVRFENLAEIAFEEYTSTVVPALVVNGSYQKTNDFTMGEIRSAELLGPFPIFFAPAIPERFNNLSSHVNNIATGFYNVDEFVDCFRHSDDDGGCGWLFIAMVEDEPVALFTLWGDGDYFSASLRYEKNDAIVANAAYTAYQKLAHNNASEKFILYVGRGMNERPDMFFTDDSNKLAFFSEPGVERPLVTYVDFVDAVNKAASQASVPKISKSFARFLFEDEPPAVRQPTFFLYGLLLGGNAAFLGVALFLGMRKWRKRTAPHP